ncbi:MAG: DUF3604 domain-containing protein, partial [Candidatus Brocadiia bacterium]
MNYQLLRYSDEERICQLSNGNQPDQWESEPFSTISAHLYQGPYFPGSRPGKAEDQTSFRARLDGDSLVFDLRMEEPSPRRLIDWLGDKSGKGFWETDCISLNFLDPTGCPVQVGIKINGATALRRAFREADASDLSVDLQVEDNQWKARVNVPLDTLGYDVATLSSAPIPFDVVRFHSSTGAISAWCPIPHQLPFNENYDYPVFCFGLLSAQDIRWADYGGADRDIGTFQYAGPSQVTAGSYSAFAVEYTVGENGFEPGGALKFCFNNEVIECNRNSKRKRPLPEKNWSPLQWDDPAKPGFVDVTCDGAGAEFRLDSEDVFSTRATLTGPKGLSPGDTVRIEVGLHDACPGIRAQLLTQDEFPLKTYVDPMGTGLYLSPQKFPRLDVVGAPAGRLELFAQPTPEPGETSRVTITAIDSYGNVADGYEGEIRIHCPAKARGLPERYEFNSEDGGSVTFEVIFDEGDVFQILAEDTETGGISGESNLIVTDGSFGPGKLYFGDIHTHSQLSDGRLHPEEKYHEVARHRGLDFWALTDHAHDFDEQREELWRRTIERHNNDGRFVTLYGYEWTNSMGLRPRMRADYGHRNIYFRKAPPTLRDGVWHESASPREVWERYKEEEVDFFCINHFHCGSPESVEGVDRSVEVSGWCGEFVRDSLHRSGGYNDNIFDTLDDGLKVGVVAGTDHGTEAYYSRLPAELTAVRADSLSRDCVYDALHDGQSYATSGQRTLLKFTVNGETASPHGDPVQGSERQLEIVIGSAVPVQRVDIIKNRERWEKLNGSDDPVHTYLLTDTEDEPAKGYYLVRVHTVQGHTTWSSP